MNDGARPPEGRDEGRDESGHAQTHLAQHRALNATRDVLTAHASAELLRETGPLAELLAADRRGVLDEARRRLIARKGAGVVFEATTVVQLQEGPARYGLSFAATLSKSSTDTRADIRVTFERTEILLQLKTGRDKYLKAAVRAKPDGTLVFVPRDAPALGEGVASELVIDDVPFEAPTRDRLVAQTEAALERLETGEPITSLADLAGASSRAALADGVVAAVLDLAVQWLTQPETPIDLGRTARCVLKTAATTAAASFLAGANARASAALVTRGADASRAFRSTRVAACVVPHAIDAAFDLSDHLRGDIDGDELVRRLGHLGHKSNSTKRIEKRSDSTLEVRS